MGLIRFRLSNVVLSLTQCQRFWFTGFVRQVWFIGKTCVVLRCIMEALDRLFCVRLVVDRSRLHVLAVMLFLAPAEAGVITRADFTGGETVITFDSGVLPSVGNHASPFTVQGLTFSSQISGFSFGNPWNPFPATPDDSGGNYIGDLVMASDFSIALATPVSKIGMWVNGGNSATSWAVTAYDSSSQVLESATFIYPNTAGQFPFPSIFIGFADNGISSLKFHELDDNNQYSNIDDVRFVVVPEPSALAVVGLGAVGMAILARRKSAAGSGQ
jgi:hypothetical protein